MGAIKRATVIFWGIFSLMSSNNLYAQTKRAGTIPRNFVGTWLASDADSIPDKIVIKTNQIIWHRKKEGKEIIDANNFAVSQDGQEIRFASRSFYAEDVFWPKTKYYRDIDVIIRRAGESITILIEGKKMALGGGAFLSGRKDSTLYNKVITQSVKKPK